MSLVEEIEYLRKSLKLAEELVDSGTDRDEYEKKLDMEKLSFIFMGENRLELLERILSCDPSSEEHNERREAILQAYRGLSQEEREIQRLIMRIKGVSDSYHNTPQEKEWYRSWIELLNLHS